MAKTGTGILDLVREELRRNPNATTAELFEKAKKVDRGVAKLSIRQFHARYPLQVKRQLAMLRPKRRRRSRGRAANRPAIKAELLAFAKALLEADSVGIVDMLGRADAYADRLLAAAGTVAGRRVHAGSA